MLSLRQVAAATTVTVVATFSVSPPASHAATNHGPVVTSSTNTNGNNLQYSENYDNSHTASRQAIVGMYAVITGLAGIHFPDPFDQDLYGTFVYAFHYTGPECLSSPKSCWHVDAGLAQYGSSVSSAFEPVGEPCEWIVWYAWDWTSKSQVYGGNFC